MAIARYGLREFLPPSVELVSGPGCPVCVTETGYIDAAVQLARRGVMIATFGDLLNVPGSQTTLAECRAAHADISVCYSPLEALGLALKHPHREVVFLAVGFETTMAPVVAALDLAIRKGVRNFSLLTAFKLVPPALRVLRDDPTMRIDAFLCPGHVSAIIGSQAYAEFAGRHGVPCVIAGFEPLDIILGLTAIIQQLVRREARVENQYGRVVKPQGNPKAQAFIDKYLYPVDARWRGLGLVPQSGMALRPEHGHFDAERRLNVVVEPGQEPPGCLCGEVVKGKIRPPACSLFGSVCNPDHPIGPCMVSYEGTCAAYYKYLVTERSQHA